MVRVNQQADGKRLLSFHTGTGPTAACRDLLVCPVAFLQRALQRNGYRILERCKESSVSSSGSAQQMGGTLREVGEGRVQATLGSATRLWCQSGPGHHRCWVQPGVSPCILNQGTSCPEGGQNGSLGEGNILATTMA